MAPRRETAPYRKALGQAIRRRRAELELSQEDMSFDAEVDRTYLSGLEAGDRNPTLETIWRIAQSLSATPGELLVEAEASMKKRKRD